MYHQVSKDVKVFNVGDEFVLHVFKAHLAASICTILNIGSPTDPIEHTESIKWLQETAATLVSKTISPSSSQDRVYAFHRSFMHMAFLYLDLRNAIGWENGPHIIRHWRIWIPRFIGTGCKNYAVEAVNTSCKH